MFDPQSRLQGDAMLSVEGLREEVSEYDGRSPTVLSEISVRYRSQTGYLSDLVTLASDEVATIAEGATWMIKAELEEGRRLTPQDVERLISGLNDVKTWQAQLHICQSIRYLTVPKMSERSVENWLKKILNARRPLLRAWSADAYCRLGGSSRKTKSLLEQMEGDEAASVRARARNLKREFGLDNCH